MRSISMVFFVASALLFVESNVVFAESKLIAAPFVRILTNPAEFIDKRVRVVGYLTFSPSLALYLTRDHAEFHDVESSVPVHDGSKDGSLTSSSCLNHYVQLTGTVRKRSDIKVELVDVEKVLRLDEPSICWARGQK